MDWRRELPLRKGTMGEILQGFVVGSGNLACPEGVYGYDICVLSVWEEVLERTLARVQTGQNFCSFVHAVTQKFSMRQMILHSWRVPDGFCRE